MNLLSLRVHLLMGGSSEDIDPKKIVNGILLEIWVIRTIKSGH